MQISAISILLDTHFYRSCPPPLRYRPLFDDVTNLLSLSNSVTNCNVPYTKELLNRYRRNWIQVSLILLANCNGRQKQSFLWMWSVKRGFGISVWYILICCLTINLCKEKKKIIKSRKNIILKLFGRSESTKVLLLPTTGTLKITPLSSLTDPWMWLWDIRYDPISVTVKFDIRDDVGSRLFVLESELEFSLRWSVRYRS